MVKHSCISCIYSTSNKWVFDRHVQSDRHKTNAAGLLSLENLKTYQFACSICEKKFVTSAGLWKHKNTKHQPATKESMPSEELTNTILAIQDELKELRKSRMLTTAPPVVEPRQHTEYIYLLQEREFYVSQQPVYKIGKTKQPNHKRFLSYPKGSVLLLQRICRDCDQEEQRLLQIFKEKFSQRRDIGTEYFEGDQERMMDEINAK